MDKPFNRRRIAGISISPPCAQIKHFAIVCAGVWILRVRHPELPRPFKTPLVPLVPILGIATSLYLVWTLPALTKEVVFGWLLLGLIVYFTYSVKHSKVQIAIEEGKVKPETL